MGSIFKNGAEYPAGTSKAIDQSYDNTNSGIAAVTTQGAIDELSSNLGNINVYVSEDKKLHFVDKDGADTELPFSGSSIGGVDFEFVYLFGKTQDGYTREMLTKSSSGKIIDETFDFIPVGSDAAGTVAFFTVDLTDYNQLFLVGRNAGNTVNNGGGIAPKNQTFNAPNNSFFSVGFSSFTQNTSVATFDISELNGEYWVGFGGYQNPFYNYAFAIYMTK